METPDEHCENGADGDRVSARTTMASAGLLNSSPTAHFPSPAARRDGPRGGSGGGAFSAFSSSSPSARAAAGPAGRCGSWAGLRRRRRGGGLVGVGNVRGRVEHGSHRSRWRRCRLDVLLVLLVVVVAILVRCRRGVEADGCHGEHLRSKHQARRPDTIEAEGDGQGDERARQAYKCILEEASNLPSTCVESNDYAKSCRRFMIPAPASDVADMVREVLQGAGNAPTRRRRAGRRAARLASSMAWSNGASKGEPPLPVGGQ